MYSSNSTNNKREQNTNTLLIILTVLIGILLLAVIIIGILILQHGNTTNESASDPQSSQNQEIPEQQDKAEQIIEKAENRCGVLANHENTLSITYFPALDSSEKTQGECLVNMMPESAYRQFQNDQQKAMRDCGTTHQGSKTIDGIQYSWFSACSSNALDVGSSIEYKMLDAASNSPSRDSTSSAQEDIDKTKTSGLIADIGKRCGDSVIEGNHVKVSWDQVHEGIEQGEIMVCVIDFFTDDVRLPYKKDHERAVQYYQEYKKPLIGHKIYNGYKYSWKIGKSDDSDNPKINYTTIVIEEYNITSER